MVPPEGRKNLFLARKLRIELRTYGFGGRRAVHCAIPAMSLPVLHA